MTLADKLAQRLERYRFVPINAAAGEPFFLAYCKQLGHDPAAVDHARGEWMGVECDGSMAAAFCTRWNEPGQYLEILGTYGENSLRGRLAVYCILTHYRALVDAGVVPAIVSTCLAKNRVFAQAIEKVFDGLTPLLTVYKYGGG